MEPFVVKRRRGLLRLTGPQATWFLGQTVTADIDAASEGRWTESCFLTPKGKIVARFRAGRISEEHVLLDVDEPGTTPLLDWFTRYRFRTKVEFEDLSGDVSTVVGRTIGEAGTFTEHGDFTDDLATDLRTTPPPGLKEATEEEFEHARIAAGVPRFGIDYGPDNLPQEAGLTHAVSVTKGCYVGQEVMARLHFRGHVNKTVRPLTIDGKGDPGDELRADDAKVGTITSRAGAHAIGMIRLVVPSGAVLQVLGGGEAVAGPIPPGTKLVTA